jgi:MarR family transcriptional regulator for hemolysin
MNAKVFEMLHYDFEQSVGYWVVMTAQALQRTLNDELARHGITFRQWQVLAWLALEGELSQTDLAERMSIEPPTLVGILDRMERDGWISRNECPSDRRKKLVRPTPRVEPVWSKMVACARKVRAQAVRGIDDSQVEQLKQLLAAMQHNLRAENLVGETVQ